MYSNVTRMTGLSGMDVESMVTKLMRAESMKYDRLFQKNMLLGWRQEAYRGQADKLLTFQKDYLSLTKENSIRLSSTFAKSINTISGSSSSSSSSDVEVVSSRETPAGKYNVTVSQLATKDIYEGTATIPTDIKGTPFDVMNIKAGGTFYLSYNGSTKTITFTDNEIATIQNMAPGDRNTEYLDLLNQKLITAVGKNGTAQRVTALFNTDGGLILEAIPGNNLAIYDSQPSQSVIGAFDVKYDTDGFDPNTLYNIKVKYNMDGFETVSFAAGADINETVANINAALDAALFPDLRAEVSEGKIIFKKADGSYENDKYVVMDDEANPGAMEFLGYGGQEFTLGAASQLDMLGLKSGMNNNILTQKIGDAFKDVIEREGLLDSSGNLSVTINGKTLRINKNMTIDDAMSFISTAAPGVTMKYTNGVFKLESKETGFQNAIDFDENSILTKGFGFTIPTVSAKDAILNINGNTYLSASNTAQIDDYKLTLKLNAVNDDGITIEVKKDTEAAFKSIKDFVEGYNKMLDEVNSMLSERRPKYKGEYYMPLTSDQKRQMTESDIEDWEKNAKKGLLQGDSIFEDMTRKMRTMLYQPVDLGDGKKISLYEIGITTGAYNNKGKLVIDERKLKKALDERYEDVTQLFVKSADVPFSNDPKYAARTEQRLKDEGIAERVNDIISMVVGNGGKIEEKAGMKGTASEMTNSIYKELKKQADQMQDMLAYLADKENYYYSMFAQMEKAMIKSDNQMSSLMGMLGK